MTKTVNAFVATEMKLGENTARVSRINESVVLSFSSHGSNFQLSFVLDTAQAEELAFMLSMSVREENEAARCCSLPTMGEFGECTTCGSKLDR